MASRAVAAMAIGEVGSELAIFDDLLELELLRYCGKSCECGVQLGSELLKDRFAGVGWSATVSKIQNLIFSPLK